MRPTLPNWAADWLPALAIGDTEQVCVRRLCVRKVTDPALRVEPAEYMPLICFDEHDGRTFAITLLMEVLRCVNLNQDR